MARNLFLMSSGQAPGYPYLAHAIDALLEFLDGRRTIHFVPYALADVNDYTRRQQEAVDPYGLTIRGVHEDNDPAAAIEAAEILFVGGGNSFRLLKNLHERGLIDPIRRRVFSGELPYMGSSAGTNMSCPSLRTTNDMPIVQPPSFSSLGLIPFQINPHYLDPDPTSNHLGETRPQRIAEFLEENDVPVLGLREGSWLRVQDDVASVGGAAGGYLFVRGAEPAPVSEGEDLSWLLRRPSLFDTRF